MSTSQKKRPTSKKRTAPARKKTRGKPVSGRAKKERDAFVRATGRECFWVHNGPILRDIEELYEALATMPEEQYHYHVRDGRHDFADWVEAVLNDRTLARRLRKTGSRKPAATAVAKRIREIT